MSTSDHDEPGKPAGPATPASGNRARQLFGHKGGASPWEGAGKAQARPGAEPVAASAPYPRDAQYTPREGSPGEDFFSEVDDEGELTRLHPNYKLLMRFGALIAGLVLFIAVAVVEGILRSELGLPMGVLLMPGAIIAIIIGFRVPVARYNARGYQISRDRLRVVRGIWWHSDTIVPFGRVQHIDVDQGPVERALGIATMTLHTAGSHNASVRLPGLGHERAIAMREAIRAHIKRETL
ncbi:PH domain-containing protein [Qipengyuania nanhaisediminis]|uniref:PH domain-containing protein n=1 Tax=Qipengyuania nanhaisediminis TaxID=604088 RepID=UPI0038B3ECE9